MSELADYGITIDTLRDMYTEWQGGAPKTHLELKYLNKTESHGKLFSGLVRRYLGKETEKPHPMVDEISHLREENERLRQLLLKNGVDPRG